MILNEAFKSEIKIFCDISVYWSHYSQVECELFLLQKAVEKGPFAYYHLLSGQCFPIKSQQYIHEFFIKNAGKEFIDYQSSFFEKNSELILKRIRYYHPFRKYCRSSTNKWINKLFCGINNIFVLGQKVIKIDRCKKNNLDICYGANWFSITDAFAKYVLSKRDFIKQNFKWSNCPDELFMQTILKSSPFLCNLYKETNNYFYGNMRLVDFKRGNPYIYRSKDINEIKDSAYLFIRKVDERIDKNILELINLSCSADDRKK